MVNYNWNAASDIDLHLLLDIASMKEDEEFIKEYLVAKKPFGILNIIL